MRRAIAAALFLALGLAACIPRPDDYVVVAFKPVEQIRAEHGSDAYSVIVPGQPCLIVTPLPKSATDQWAWTRFFHELTGHCFGAANAVHQDD